MKLLGCFFPTTVVLVDDDPAFLKFLRLSLAECSFICRCFSDPFKALDFVNGASQENNKLGYLNLIKDSEKTGSKWDSISLGANQLCSEIYSPARFSRISVVVSDYKMPNMNGVEFCSKIADKNIQKVLLTGLVEDKIAIDAFNAGHISQFVRKNLSMDIVEAVNSSAHKYFETYTEYIQKQFFINELEHLRDPVFAEFFSKIYTQGKFVEYYMLDSSGSYLLMKSDGSKRMLSVLTETEFARLVDIAIASGEADPKVIEQMQSRERMPVYRNRVGSLPPVSDWAEFLEQPTIVEGHRTYYCVLSTGDRANLDEDRIVPFDSFKERNQ